MPTMPGRTERPRRSRMVAPSRGSSSAPGMIAAILPAEIRTLRSARGAAPVPSMTSTCSRITSGVSTRRYLRTGGPSRSTRCAAAGPDHADAAAQRSDRIRGFMWSFGPSNTATAPAFPCGPSDLFPAAALLRAEERVDHPHVGHRVLHAVGQVDLPADGPGEGLALERVLVARRQRLGGDRGAVERGPVVEQDARGGSRRGVEGDLDLDPAAGPADLHALVGHAPRGQ